MLEQFLLKNILLPNNDDKIRFCLCTHKNWMHSYLNNFPCIGPNPVFQCYSNWIIQTYFFRKHIPAKQKNVITWYKSTPPIQVMKTNQKLIITEKEVPHKDQSWKPWSQINKVVSNIYLENPYFHVCTVFIICHKMIPF